MQMWRSLQLLPLLPLLLASFAAATSCPAGWSASVSVPGKCYFLGLAGGAGGSTGAQQSSFARLVEACASVSPGADVLAVANAFENTELKQLLTTRGIHEALIGLVRLNAATSRWLSVAGSTSYTNFVMALDANASTSVRFTSLLADGTWQTAGAGVLAVGCQLYPNDTTTASKPFSVCPDGWSPLFTASGKCLTSVGAPSAENVTFFEASQLCADAAPNAELATFGDLWEQIEVSSTWTHTFVNYVSDGSGATPAWHWSGQQANNTYAPSVGCTTGVESGDGWCGAVLDYVDQLCLFDCALPMWTPVGQLCQIYVS